MLTICSFPIIHPKIPQLFLQSSLLFNAIAFYACKQILRLENLKTKQAMNMKFNVYYVEAIIYLLFYNLHDRAFQFLL